MEEYYSDLDSDLPNYWRDWFITARGNEYFCEVDEDYISDRFNLTGLNNEVQYYQYALEMITDVLNIKCDENLRIAISRSAKTLYGLIHARYIITARGLAKMLEKYEKADFGSCPRVLCQRQPLLPVGLTDSPNLAPVKLYCPRCEDLYNPKSVRHMAIDGAFFGTSFPGMFFQVYPYMVCPKSRVRYEPKVFGFKIHAIAALHRWQDKERHQMIRRLKKHNIECSFDGECEDCPSESDNESCTATAIAETP